MGTRCLVAAVLIDRLSSGDNLSEVCGRRHDFTGLAAMLVHAFHWHIHSFHLLVETYVLWTLAWVISARNAANLSVQMWAERRSRGIGAQSKQHNNPKKWLVRTNHVEDYNIRPRSETGLRDSAVAAKQVIDLIVHRP